MRQVRTCALVLGMALPAAAAAQEAITVVAPDVHETANGPVGRAAPAAG